MKVYILEGYFFGDGNEVVGVYTTMDFAKDAEKRNPQPIDDRGLEYEFYNIIEFEINTP